MVDIRRVKSDRENQAQGSAEPFVNATTSSASTEKSFLILHDYPSPGFEKLWSEFLERIESPAHYDAPAYFLEPYWANKRPFAVLAIENNRVIGVLTGLHAAGGITCGLASRPQIRVDRAADMSLATELLAKGLLQEAGHETLITVFSWSWLPLPAFERRGFLRCELEGDVVLDLTLGTDTLFKQAHENRRRNIRTALKNGVEVSEAITQEDLAAYWQVYSTWRHTERKKIVHDHTFDIIEMIHNQRENHRRFLARYKGRVVAATGLRFLRNGLVEYANNCSLDEFMHVRPNDLLIWRTIEWSSQQGFARYSLGGAHPFLRKSGGTVVPIYRYRLDRTLLRRHDLKDTIRAKIRSLVDKAPAGLGQTIRNLLRPS